MNTDWVILRCSGMNTLKLADSLHAAGFDVWTPREVRERLAGRARELIEQETPILPEYVFARFDHLSAMLALSRSPTLNYQVWDNERRRMVTKGRPHFWLFQCNGGIRPIPDASLAGLRALEAELIVATERRREANKQKGPAPRFEAGQTVRVDGSGFDGLDLTVSETNEGKMVKLTHPNWMWTVEISAWKLQQVQLEGRLPEQAVAKAA